MSNLPFVPRATALAAAAFALSLSASAPAVAGPAVMSSGPNTACGTGTTAPGTLSDYQATGGAGCTVGTATFYDFSPAYEYIAGSPTGNDPAPLIDVAPGANPALPSLRFSSTLFNRLLLNTPGDYYFEYYIDPPIDILGFGLNDLPFVGSSYVEASVCVGATFNDSLTAGDGVPPYGGGEGAPTLTGGEGFTPQDSCSFSSPVADAEFRSAFVQNQTPQYYYFNINDAQTSDVQLFTQPDQFADVLIHVHVDANGLVPDFGTGPVLGVPEPGTWALTGLGGLALAGVLRRRRRRWPTGLA